MSGTAIEIYLKTIATGDGAKRTAQDYLQVVKVAKDASREMSNAAKQAAQDQKKAAADAAAAVKKAEADKAVAAKRSSQEQAVAAKQAAQAQAAAARQAASAQKRAADEAIAEAKRVAREQEKAAQQAADAAAKATSGKAQGILEISRAVEDAQYGIRGVLNNIPQMVASFGGGAGLAGGISLAAVGLTSLLPLLSNWLGITEKLDDALGGTAAKLREQADAAMQGLIPAEEAAEQASKKFEEQLRKEQAALDATNRSMESKLELLKLNNSIQSAADKAKLDADIQDIKAQKLPPAEEARQIAIARVNNNQASKDRAQNEVVTEIHNADNRTVNAAVTYDAAKRRREQLEQQREDSRRGWSYQGQQGNDQEQMEQARLKHEMAQDNLRDTSGMHPDNVASLQRVAAQFEAEYKAKKDIYEGRQKELQSIQQKYGGAIPNAPDEQVLGSARNMEIQREAELREARMKQSEVHGKAASDNVKIHNEFETTQRDIARDYTGVALPGANIINNGPLPKPSLPQSTLELPWALPPEMATRPLLPGMQNNLLPPPSGLGPEVTPLPSAVGRPLESNGQSTAPSGPPPAILGGDKIVSSNNQANETFVNLAEAVVSANADMMKRVNNLESKLRDMRATA